MGYFKTVGIALDQLGMALCGGNEDCTISATTGHYQRTKWSWYWEMMRWIIDWTFYPVDGKGHCEQAYKKDIDEKFREGYKLPLFVLTVLFCLGIGIILWSIWLFKKGYSKLGSKA
jgi:hypothetical protein